MIHDIESVKPSAYLLYVAMHRTFENISEIRLVTVYNAYIQDAMQIADDIWTPKGFKLQTVIGTR